MNIRDALSDFIYYGKLLAEFSKDKSNYISLGNNCLISYYLKDIGLKKESYPFDWVFSSAEIIESCIKDDFSSYLNVDLIKPDSNKKSAGHLSMHKNFFNHKNPLADSESFSYYKRTIERFLLQKEQKENLYLINIIKNPEQRKGWSNGFYSDVHLKQNFENYTNLCELLPFGKFVFFEIYTDTVETSIEIIKRTNSYVVLKIKFKGKSDGVCFKNRESDYFFKLLLTFLQRKF